MRSSFCPSGFHQLCIAALLLMRHNRVHTYACLLVDNAPVQQRHLLSTACGFVTTCRLGNWQHGPSHRPKPPCNPFEPSIVVADPPVVMQILAAAAEDCLSDNGEQHLWQPIIKEGAFSKLGWRVSGRHEPQE